MANYSDTHYEQEVKLTYAPRSAAARLLRTYSELTRASSQAEALERAAANDYVLYQADNWLDPIRVASPLARVATYTIQRLIPPTVAAEWDAYAGAGAEAGYLHVSGVRLRTSAGNYVMNMGSAAYVTWWTLLMKKQLAGRRYSTPGQHPASVNNAILVDITLWYQAFDAAPQGEHVLTSDEYQGTGDQYALDCASAFATQAAAIREVFAASHVMPNFGDLLFAGYTDAQTLALIAAATHIEVQQAISWSNGEPNLTAIYSTQRWDLLTTGNLAGTTVFAHALLITPQDSGSKARAKLGSAAWFLMAARDGLHARFATGTDLPGDISTWEDNALFLILDASLGAAASAYNLLSGPWNKGNVYRRTFEHGEALMFLRKAGQVGSETATVSFQTGRPYAADGTLGPDATSMNLSLGQGAIVLYSGSAEPTGPPVSIGGRDRSVIVPTDELAIQGHERGPVQIGRPSYGISVAGRPAGSVTIQ